MLEYLLGTESAFGLVSAEQIKFRETATKVREALAPLLSSRRCTDRWPGTRLIGHYAIVETYRCDPSALPVLLEPGSLFAWLQPKYPEDLHFLSSAGLPSLITVSHEHDAWIANPTVAKGASRLIPLKKENVEDKYREVFGLGA